MQILIGEKHFSVTLENYDTASALTEILPLTLDMSELNGNEKYYYLDTVCLPHLKKSVISMKAILCSMAKLPCHVLQEH